jgi:hypothetical protein
MRCPECTREIASDEVKTKLLTFPTNIEFCWKTGNANCALMRTANTLGQTLHTVLVMCAGESHTYRSPDDQARIRAAWAILTHVMGPPPKVPEEKKP